MVKWVDMKHKIGNMKYWNSMTHLVFPARHLHISLALDKMPNTKQKTYIVIKHKNHKQTII